MTDESTLRFMKLLVGGATARAAGSHFEIALQSGFSKLDNAQIRTLVSQGLVFVAQDACNARHEARGWLKRQMADHDHQAAQHRTLTSGTDEVEINLNESPLAKLAYSTNGSPAFLSPHHLLAGERVRGLFEKAHLVQHTTMSYDPARVSSSRNGPSGGNVSDMAIDARKALAEISKALPPDCAGVVMDVCGFLKGLQQVETERRWPRRSAKLVLRIGLEQAATYFGYSPVALGAESRRDHNWLGKNSRPTEYG